MLLDLRDEVVLGAPPSPPARVELSDFSPRRLDVSSRVDVSLRLVDVSLGRVNVSWRVVALL